MSKRLTDIAHELVAAHVLPGDKVIDATTGNGHDTLFLAELVGETGHVYAFDIQQQAIRKTASRLEENSLRDRVTLIPGSHADMIGLLPEKDAGRIAAILFNLGYLPGGEKHVTTCAGTTLQALEESLALLKPGGIISLLVYVGHPGGKEEDEAIREWLGRLPVEVRWQHHNPDCAEHSPRLYSIIKG